MNLETLFEAIYEVSNYATETETTSLESPMESTAPMLFEKIYFECNIFPRIFESNTKLPNLYDHADKIIDILNRLFKNDNTAKKEDFYYQTNFPHFYVADTTILKQKYNKIALQNSFLINYNTIKKHHIGKGLKKNDQEHILSSQILKEVCKKINNPFIITEYRGPNSYDFFLDIKIAGQMALVGINNGAISDIRTIFGWNTLDETGIKKSLENVLFVDWNNIDMEGKKKIADLIDLDNSPNINI